MKTKRISTFLQLLLCTIIIFNASLFGQAPSISYTTPQTYPLNTAISSLTPTNSGGAAAAYYPASTTLISGLHTPTDVAVSYFSDIIVGNSTSPGGITIYSGGSTSTLGSALVTALGVNKYYNNGTPGALYNYIFFLTSGSGNISYYDNSTPTRNLTSTSAFGLSTSISGLAVDYSGGSPYLYVIDGASVYRLNLASPGNTATHKDAVSGITHGTPVRITNANGLVWVYTSAGYLYYITPTSATAATTQSSGIPLGAPWFTMDASNNAYLTLINASPLAGMVSKLSASQVFTTLDSASYPLASNYAGIAVDFYNNLYVANRSTNTIQKYTYTKPYSNSPALPTGLTLDSSTGIISGTPTVSTSATTYTITAGNQYKTSTTQFYGTGSTTINITTQPAYTWLGTTSSTSTSSNWFNNTAPTSSSTIIIPSSASNQPVLGADLTVAGITFTGSGATLDLNGHTLTITGAVTGSGSFKGSSASNLVIGGTVGTINFASGSNILGNLTINSGSVTLGNALNLLGTLTPTGGTLTTGGNLSLKSIGTGTAVVGVVGGIISGTVNVERFIPQGYVAYRDLGVSVASTGTIASTFGASLNNYSVYTYSLGSGWTTVANSSSLTKNVGYRVFVNGYQNSTPSSGTTNNMNSAVTLTYSGTLNTGSQSISCTGGTNVFSFISNPYASQVDFTALTKSGLYNGYWYLNPTTLYSGFERYSYYGANLGSSNIYTGSVTQYIQPGQGFFVCSSGSGSPSLGFTESAKNNGTSQTAIFGITAPLNRIATGLFNNGQNVDGAVIVFNSSFSNAVSTQDGLKINNHDENISFNISGQDLCAKGWSLPTENDLLQIHLYQLHPNTNYTLRLDASQFVSNTVQAYLQDNVLNTKTLLAGDNNTIAFATATDTASYSNRYSVVFIKSTLPVNSINVTAIATNEQVAIDWNVIGASNVISYTVEHSVNGNTFTTIASVSATSSASYTYTDAEAAVGVNYYRIKATDKEGNVNYSKVVSVSVNNSSGLLSVYPNPVTTNSLTLKVNNLATGVYALKIVNSLGQTVFTHSLNHSISTTLEHLTISEKLTAGSYSLIASGNGATIKSELIIK